jgi:predicted MFS family arabinose efflux permease
MTTGRAADPWRTRALVPVLVFLGMVVAVIGSLGAPLVPTIAATDGVSLATAQWSLTITFLVGAVATPTMGRLADGPRRRPVVLGALALVVLGSVLAALPLGFHALLLGRALQGIGLGLTSLAIAIARDHVSGEAGRSAVAMLSVTTVAGVGLGYPLTGLIAQQWGVHAGFWFGATVGAVALVLAVLVIPSSRGREGHPLDVTGAVLLGSALVALLLVLSEAAAWGWNSPLLLAVAAGSLLLLATWVRHELRTAHPLVDLRLLRHRSVLAADVTGLFAGVGMYLLLSLITRYVQTPTSAGYGFGSSILVAGLALLPFSVGSVAASRVAPLLARRTSPDLVLPIGSLLFLAAMASFALARGSLWMIFITMGVAGLGVGCTFAAMPGLIVGAVPAAETGSATSVNQVLRTVGYSAGSALSATVLEAHTAVGQALPDAGGYATAAWLGCGVWVVTAVLSYAIPHRRHAPPGRLPVPDRPVDAPARAA